MPSLLIDDAVRFLASQDPRMICADQSMSPTRNALFMATASDFN